jgi:hypothetical protein
VHSLGVCLSARELRCATETRQQRTLSSIKMGPEKVPFLLGPYSADRSNLLHCLLESRATGATTLAANITAAAQSRKSFSVRLKSLSITMLDTINPSIWKPYVANLQY